MTTLSLDFLHNIEDQGTRRDEFLEIVSTITPEIFLQAIKDLDAAVKFSNNNGVLGYLATQIPEKPNKKELHLTPLKLNAKQFELLIQLLNVYMDQNKPKLLPGLEPPKVPQNATTTFFVANDKQIQNILEMYSNTRNAPIDKYLLYIRLTVYYLLAKNKQWIDRK